MARASGLQTPTFDNFRTEVCVMAMRYQIEFIRSAPHHGDPVVVETIDMEAASLREAEARAHAHFEDINLAEMADGFRILQDRHVGEVLRWLRPDIRRP
jgi:hypothetical protein